MRSTFRHSVACVGPVPTEFLFSISAAGVSPVAPQYVLIRYVRPYLVASYGSQSRMRGRTYAEELVCALWTELSMASQWSVHQNLITGKLLVSEW